MQEQEVQLSLIATTVYLFTFYLSLFTKLILLGGYVRAYVVRTIVENPVNASQILRMKQTAMVKLSRADVAEYEYPNGPRLPPPGRPPCLASVK